MRSFRPHSSRRTPEAWTPRLASLALLLALQTGCGGCASAPASVDAGVLDISTTLEPFRATSGMPALAGAVFRGGTLLAQGATGVRSLGETTRVSTSDEWHLGSDTKAMTATLIGLYVDKGTLHFQDTLGTLFPGETIAPGLRDVTLDQLLQHRGGMPANFPEDVWTQMWADGTRPTARMKAVRAVLALPPAQAPGTYVYSNVGYVLAGAALERAAGDSWEHLMVSRLWGPLGMTSCGFGPAGAAGQLTEPWGHKSNPDGTLTPVDPGDPSSDNPPSMGPAGTAHCSLGDWGKFLALHLAGARSEATPLVSTATLKHLQTPPPGGDYACGWGVYPHRAWADGTVLSHTGSNTFSTARVWLAPAKNLAFVLATNCATPRANTGLDDALGPLIKSFAR
jgi:D-alanyl-D-alanine carboxypeptidase